MEKNTVGQNATKNGTLPNVSVSLSVKQKQEGNLGWTEIEAFIGRYTRMWFLQRAT